MTTDADVSRRRRTRILATLGPASFEHSVIDGLVAAGLNAVRLNFSHGTHEWHAEAFRRVREAASRHGREIAILQDLQGPKIRLGTVRGEIHAATGSSLTITTRSVVGEGNVVPTDYPALATDVEPGMRILLDEGRLVLLVRSVEGQDVLCDVVDGGVISSHKGLSIPGAALTTAAMTEKDRADVRFGLDLGVDFVALSFVRSAADIDELRTLMRELGREVPIIAKIERPQALENLDAIIAASEGTMVARGDLAIEASLDMVPVHQKRIIERANRAGKLVITATQMLESMTENPLPTRAEVTDVANAILDGTDAVMLSGETAVGKHPIEAVRRMASIASVTEETLYPFDRPVRPAPGHTDPLARVTARAAAQAAHDGDARAIVVFTRSGATAATLSDERPRAPIIAFTSETATLRRLALYWGVQPLPLPPVKSAEELMEYAERLVVERDWATSGDRVVFVLGARVAAGAAHSIRLVELGGPEAP